MATAPATKWGYFNLVIILDISMVETCNQEIMGKLMINASMLIADIGIKSDESTLSTSCQDLSQPAREPG